MYIPYCSYDMRSVYPSLRSRCNMTRLPSRTDFNPKWTSREFSGSLNRFHRQVSGNSNIPVRANVFSKWKKILLYPELEIDMVYYPLQSGKDFLSLGSEVSTAESHLVKNCTYISGSHHDVYLVQFSNYRSDRVIILTNQMRMVTLAT